ncbi:MAG: hypothetical protein NT018_02480 [Armatimonadetes bacterium]|nr:hypothetical protein [Armatimonadota bacterium]
MSRKIYVGLALAVLLSVSAQAFAAAPLKLPYGPEGKGRFGAYYTKLNYSPEWDALWRVGDKADVVVRFDEYDYRVVFWRGTNYVPFWVNEKRVWYSDGCVERSNASPKWDKLCKYSFVSIVESNDARVVVRWRYALVDKDYKLINTDPITNWNDWVDEYYTIYPDAYATRTIKLFSSDLEDWILYSHALYMYQPDNQLLKGAKQGASLARILDEWGSMADEYQQEGPLQWPILDSADADRIRVLAMRGENLKPYAEDKTSRSWRTMLRLVKNADYRDTTPDSWLSAPKLTARTESSFTIKGFDQSDKAYHIVCGGPSTLKLQLAASAASPVYNPAFVIKGWGKNDISLSIDGKPIKRGPDFRYGFRKTDTVSDLIIWVKKQSTKLVSIEIKPLQGGK